MNLGKSLNESLAGREQRIDLSILLRAYVNMEPRHPAQRRLLQPVRNCIFTGIFWQGVRASVNAKVRS